MMPFIPGGKFLAPAECSICQALTNAQGLKLGEPARRTHGVLSHKDGRAIPVSYSGVQVVVDGSIQGAVMTFYDDSQRRRLEASFGIALRSSRSPSVAKPNSSQPSRMSCEILWRLFAPRLQVMRKASDNATSMAQLREMMERQLAQLVQPGQ